MKHWKAKMTSVYDFILAGRDDLELTAFATSEDAKQYPITTIGPRRDWMDQTTNKFAYKCLPLTIANTQGWVILNPCEFRVQWNGGPAQEDVVVTYSSKTRAKKYGTVWASHFGSGILTLCLPYLVRTNVQGIGVRCSGPENQWLNGMHALTGIVESWGEPATFTMNWKLTMRRLDVIVPKGFPLVCLSPFDFRLQAPLKVASYTEIPPLAHEAYTKWVEGRDKIIHDSTDEELKEYQGRYIRNIATDGNRLPTEHWKQLRMQEPAYSTAALDLVRPAKKRPA